MNKILLLAMALSSGIALIPCARADAPGAEFAVPHRLVDIGGRRLNLFCSGSGSPTVVFDAPAGSAAWVWWAVQPTVAAKTRACVYDRAGFGFSDLSPRAGSSGNAVDDLHRLLAAAGIAPPYVLVGNSLGGGNMELFAWQHPGEVSGLVLVEPMHEDDVARADEASQGKLAAAQGEMFALRTACAQQAEKGFEPHTEMWDQCVVGPDPAFPAALGAADLKQRMAPPYWRASKAEQDAFDTDYAQMRTARKPFGDLPLVVLARGVSPYLVPGRPPSDINKAIEAANLKLLTAVARSSTNGELRVVPDASHMIQETRPDAVAAAVDDVLSKVRR
jgi:pimeloyl-ACP methyl ester carboxylesterase